MSRRLPKVPEKYNPEIFENIHKIIRLDTEKLDNRTSWRDVTLQISQVNVSSAYLAGDKTLIFVDASASTVQVTLPTPLSAYTKVFIVKKTSTNANNVIVVPTSGVTIDTSSGYILTGANFPSVRLTSDGTNYWTF